MKKINKNGMTVSWVIKESRAYFEMEAPTTGWVAIGFNNTQEITGNYLIMGKVENKKITVEEHYTISPGNYKKLADLNETASIENIEGSEHDNKTIIKFSLPSKSRNQYAKDLVQNSDFVLLIAYSVSDDFQHHSIMRTSLKIKL